MNTDHYLRINEIKNYLYCPRISFYALCWQLDRDTAVARMGIENEAAVKKQMKRRKHALHAVHQGQRHFDVEIMEHSLRIIGRLDEVIETAEGLYLVDYKDTSQDYGYWKIQMAAYRLAIRSSTTLPILGTYIYTIPDQTYKEVKLGKHEEEQVSTIVTALHGMIASETCPAPTPHSRKCHTCQYQRFCNDVT